MNLYQEYQITQGSNTYTVYVLKTNKDLSDAVIDISYTAGSKNLLSVHYSNASSKAGCTKYAAFNGGAFVLLGTSIVESLIKNGYDYGSSSDTNIKDLS